MTTKQDYLEVIAGTDLLEVYDMFDRTAGDWVDWDAGTWEVEMEIRDRNGIPLARIANFGVRDGEMTLLAEGRLQLHLPGAVTAELPVTRFYTNSSDPSVAGWHHRKAHAFDIRATETVSGSVSGPVQGLLTVHESPSA